MPNTSFDLSALPARLGRFVLRLGFWLLAAVAIVSLLALSLGLLLIGLLRALITGKRPAPMMKFNFQSFSTGPGARFWPPGHRPTADDGFEASPPSPGVTDVPAGPGRPVRGGRLSDQSGQVVDVEAREVPGQPRA